ncbi:four-carbon acid sugar kinase family protein [Agromyces aerolatus]|uniref:four-carbon acid sugar kinase family protein n=1 Tax=Agromyces sp. LY-1074 TaxID=3074080 RepID=UPI0028600B2E|nr:MULTISPECIES: four-carbon acid sugar kinase family protein [unclassified Agromyces]MDR5700959.1 four-carbon acid sugar kinase family protein [Agromyces sp. LY-1074]MDR5707380.1 four-carbon acid sugar kinase family protein [Agromyces sp. LY-1358]
MAELARSANRTVLVAIDDDPTGAQPSGDVPLLTSWSEADLEWGLKAATHGLLYVLTNSRSLPAPKAKTVTDEAVRAIARASAKTGIPVRLLSRGDSTLRGHFPLETDAILDAWREEAGIEIDAVVLCPAYPEAGRVTVNGTHLVWAKERWIPAGETEYANDATFGYTSSYLPRWVEEKTGGDVPAASVLVVDLEQIRTGGRVVVARAMEDYLRRESSQPAVIAVDAVDPADLVTAALALSDLEAEGRNFLLRSGPTFVPLRCGIFPATPTAAPATKSPRGALIVVGSHTDLTNQQVRMLGEHRLIDAITLDVTDILNGRALALMRAVKECTTSIRAGRDVVLQTSRVVLTGANKDESLAISHTVSAAIVEVARAILATVAPAAIIAKGGITSHDIATHALGTSRAWVLGPVLDGMVSLIQPLGDDNRAHGPTLVIFPGNVGTPSSLAEVVERVRPRVPTSI